ncbi:hypothetical protein QE357_000330 [Siphonobacter sp. BAB-5404]|nr:hypothetical protein [Siphonobacter sp. SORGH_AS_0500]
MFLFLVSFFFINTIIYLNVPKHPKLKILLLQFGWFQSQWNSYKKSESKIFKYGVDKNGLYDV